MNTVSIFSYISQLKILWIKLFQILQTQTSQLIMYFYSCIAGLVNPNFCSPCLTSGQDMKSFQSRPVR